MPDKGTTQDHIADCLMCDGTGYVLAMGRRTCPDCAGLRERTEEQHNFVRRLNAWRNVCISDLQLRVFSDRVEIVNISEWLRRNYNETGIDAEEPS